MTPSADLDRYTDGAAMRTLLQARLPGFAEGRLRIDALTVSHARRNTSRDRNPSPLSLCYALQVSDTAQRRSGTQLLYARVYRANQAASVYAQQDKRLLAAPAFGQALTHLADLDMVLWALPNDPELPQLARLLDPLRAAHLVPGAAGAGVDVELLRYTPQRRATLRYTLGGAAPAGSHSGPTQLYAKTFCDGSAELLHQRFSHFWQRAQTDAQAPLVAQPLGCDAATRTLWQAPAPGLPLPGMLGDSDAAALMGGVARALALLHESGLAPAASATPRSVAHGVAEARRRERKIARADAALAPLATGVADALDHHATHLATRPLTLIHGDFHPDQIWVHQGRVVLFDFDEFTLGDPMEDLAAFAIKLEALGAAPVLVSAFVDQYAAAAPQRFDRRALAWHLTLQSLLQASRAFIYQQPGWAQTLASRLAASAERAAALPEPETT